MHIENKEYCTGCGACYNICPKGAITMITDVNGFYKPKIDTEKCINCSMCDKICPLDKDMSVVNFIKPKAYALQNVDSIREKSSSGGAFSAFANYMIKNKGIVYGVAWNKDVKAVHCRVTQESELEKIFGSKYVQSNTCNSYKNVKEDLECGKTVLYSGTPCQIAGLKSYLQKNYDRLLCMEVICHGVPSPLLLEMVKSEFERNYKEKIIKINFRSKKVGWAPSHPITAIYTEKKRYDFKTIDYMKLFLNNLNINLSCTSCQFNKLPRTADITIGDFWGVNEYDRNMNDKKGLSLVLVNSILGQNYFDLVKANCYLIKEIPLECAIYRNKNIETSTKLNPEREAFFEDIKLGKSLKYCRSKYIKVPLYIQLYRALPQFAKDFIKYKILKKH